MKKVEIIAGVLLLCAMAALSSCVKDDVDMLPEMEGRSEFRFALSHTEKSNNDFTRSGDADAEADEAPAMAIVEMESDFEEPLYLHMVSEKREAPAVEQVLDDEPTTRGAMVESSAAFINTYKGRGFGIFTYVYKPGTWNAKSTTSEYMHNIPITYWQSAGCWSSHDPSKQHLYHWPGVNYNVKFYAYVPYAGSGNYYRGVIGVDESVYKGVPVLDYTVSSANITDNNPTNHPDFMVAKFESIGGKEIPGDNNSVVKLSFEHALTAVRVLVGDKIPAGTITNVAFNGINRKAKINLSSQDWSSYSSVGKVYYAQNNSEGKAEAKPVTHPGGAITAVTKENELFMMLPQTLPAEATLTATYIDKNGKTIELKGSIGGHVWKKGGCVTYTITPDDVVAVSTFNVTAPDTNSFNYQGGETSFSVTSYVSRTDRFTGVTTTEAAPWVAEFWNGSEWVTGKPEIFATFGASGNGGAQSTMDIIVAPQKPVYQNNPLAGVGAVGTSDNPHDLSNPTGTEMNTANCYIVNAPGVYVLPLVYGNGVEKGACNFKAYKWPSGNMHNYLDVNITTPLIQDNGITIADAILVYSDEVDLVKVSPKIVVRRMPAANGDDLNWAKSNMKYLQFEVPAENIMPGNAIVAVRDAQKRIIWSWHIWVTDFNPYAAGSTTALPTVKDSSGKSYTYELMNKNLGWCPAKKVSWAARSAKYRIRQVATGETKEFTINQSAYGPETRTGNCPYYQWGRKDPMLSFCYANGDVAQEKPCYTSLDKDPSGVSYAFRIDDAKVGTTMGTAIQNPHVFYPRSEVEYDWCTTNDFELARWDGTNTLGPTTLINGDYGNKFSVNNDFEVRKTVYDPSPVGFCMPPKCAFRGLDKGLSGATGSYNTIDGSGMFTVKSVEFPTTGDRSRYSGASWYDASGKIGEYWTSSPVYGRYRRIDNGAWDVKYESAAFFITGTTSANLSDMAKSSGFAVRCIKQ